MKQSDFQLWFHTLAPYGLAFFLARESKQSLWLVAVAFGYSLVMCRFATVSELALLVRSSDDIKAKLKPRQGKFT